VSDSAKVKVQSTKYKVQSTSKHKPQRRDPD
jgi:hypothetical protein